MKGQNKTMLERVENAKVSSIQMLLLKIKMTKKIATRHVTSTLRAYAIFLLVLDSASCIDLFLINRCKFWFFIHQIK